MVSTDRLLAFAAMSFLLIVIPGPSVLFVVGRALAQGRRAALITVLGNTLGAYTLVVAVAFGVGAVVERSAIVFTTLKLVGAAYLVYLGVKAVRQRGSLHASFTAGGPAHGGLRTVWRGDPEFAGSVVALGALGVAGYQPAFFTGTSRSGVALGTVVALGSGPLFTGLIEAVGFRRPAVIIPKAMPEQLPAKDLEHVLLHELAHLALHEAVSSRVPLWFDEGYATWAAGEWERLGVLELNLAVIRGAIPDLRGLVPRHGEVRVQAADRPGMDAESVPQSSGGSPPGTCSSPV